MSLLFIFNIIKLTIKRRTSIYCTCSTKNNYEVISLCDIKKFTDKNGPFNNKPWVQISVADVLMLDCTKLAIEKIEKIYIDVSIVSTKIIDTPISPSPNSEGMTLTGKKLLIDGFICSKIVYTSLTKEQSVYTSKFMVPFCTYIVIERDADVFNDKYCVKTCIEDVFLSLIDCKTIFQNVTLFLLAEKTSITCAMPKPPNENCTIIRRIFTKNNIILNDLNNNAVLTIKFDELNNKIIVDSTGAITDPAGGQDYFKFTLLQPNGTIVKKSALIGGNENGMNFSKELSNTDFQNDDIILLQTTSKDKVIITNFPDENTPRFTLTTGEQSFKIGDNGLIPRITQEILFDNNPSVAKISFNGETKQISVVSNASNMSVKNIAKFLFKLRDANNINNIKANSRISFNTNIRDSSNSEKFASDLNNLSFKFGDIIEIQMRGANKIQINNFPKLGNSHIEQAPNNISIRIFLKIIEAGLELITPTNIPTTPKLSNTIIIKNISNQVSGVGLSFNTLDKILDVSRFNGFSFRENYFGLKFIKNNGTVVEQKKLGGFGISGLDTFINNFSNLFFDYGDKIQLDFTGGDKSSVTITNFPNQGQDYTPVKDKETYEITPDGLILDVTPDSKLPNDIVINNPDGSKFGTIFFDTSNNKFALSGFKEPYDSNSNYKVLEFKLYHSDTSRKINATLNSQDNPTNFLNAINGKDFGNNYYLELGYSDESKGNINITNFPQANTIHTPTIIREYYRVILPTGLTTHTPIMNTVKFKNGNTIIATLDFDIINKKMIPKQLVDPIPTGFHISVITKGILNGVVFKILDYDSDEDGNFEKNIFNRKVPIRILNTN